MTLENKIIWITGASSGIGKALATELSKQNSKIIISSRNESTLLAVKNECKYPENIQTLPLDLEDYADFSETVKKAISLYGKIDILINNGGISQRAKAIDTTIETDKRIMDINYMGTMSLSKAILPHFISNKSGHYVTITSITGQVATPLRSSYAASKHALHGFFDSLRSEVYDYNIAVTLVLPGYVRTQLSFNALVGDGSKQDKMDAATDTGILPEVFAKKLIKAIEKRKREVVIAGLRENVAIYMKRFFPGFLASKVRKVNVV